MPRRTPAASSKNIPTPGLDKDTETSSTPDPTDAGPAPVGETPAAVAAEPAQKTTTRAPRRRAKTPPPVEDPAEAAARARFDAVSADTLSPTPSPDEAEALARALERMAHHYALRLVASAQGLRTANLRSSVSDALASLFEMSEEASENLRAPVLRRLAQERLAAGAARQRTDEALVRARLGPLSRLLKLDGGQVDLLLLLAAMSASDVFRRIAVPFSTENRRAYVQALSWATGQPPAHFQGATDPQGGLAQTGLVEFDRTPMHADLTDYITLMNGFASAVTSGSPITDALLRKAFVTADPAKLGTDDFAYLAADARLLGGLLRPDAASGVGPGLHVLLAGEPGVGKTQFARALANSLGYTVFEVRTEDADHTPAGRADRFAYYALGLKLMAGAPRTLILFDEAEDVFTGDHWQHIPPSHDRHKGWTNRLLESATLPTIWITNSLPHVDPAYLRRMDHVLRFQVPPRSVRRSLLDAALAGTPTREALKAKLADASLLTPADIDRVGRLVGRLELPAADPAAADDAVLRLATSRPGGLTRAAATPRGTEGQIPYHLDWLRAGTELAPLIEGLRRRGQGTLAFAGPPGTGKTELARHIARALDRDLHVHKASDLLSKWLGETEQKMAQAFERAREEGAVLLLDEADSFLQDRARASHGWEVTQVNELLSQLDGFAGIAILATNHAGRLDPALLRRVDVKLTFTWLTPEHAWDAFVTAFTGPVGGSPERLTPALEARVKGLREVALGDIATVTRRNLLQPVGDDPVAFAERLEEELRLKGRPDGGRAIGFGG